MAPEKFSQPCHFCGIDIQLEWQNGLLPGDYELVADCVYHPACWDKLMEMYPPDAPPDNLEPDDGDW